MEWMSRLGSGAGPPGTRLALLLLTVGLLPLAGGCGDDDSVPDTLMDGSRVSRPPVELQGISGDPILSKVSVTDPRRIDRGSRAEACLRRSASVARPASGIVTRVGVSGESVTLRDSSGLYGCDNSPGPREADRPWCGSSFGALDRGHLRDPRLDLGCSTDDGKRLGFAWVEPDANAQFVAVEQPGIVEVYEVAGGLPVRVVTRTNVDVEGSRARFHVSEHDTQGRLLKRYVVDAVVAG
jgi:hypothetical protein